MMPVGFILHQNENISLSFLGPSPSTIVLVHVFWKLWNGNFPRYYGRLVNISNKTFWRQKPEYFLLHNSVKRLASRLDIDAENLLDMTRILKINSRRIPGVVAVHIIVCSPLKNKLFFVCFYWKSVSRLSCIYSDFIRIWIHEKNTFLFLLSKALFKSQVDPCLDEDQV